MHILVDLIVPEMCCAKVSSFHFLVRYQALCLSLFMFSADWSPDHLCMPLSAVDPLRTCQSGNRLRLTLTAASTRTVIYQTWRLSISLSLCLLTSLSLCLSVSQSSAVFWPQNKFLQSEDFSLIAPLVPLHKSLPTASLVATI